ncbi:PTS system mannose/fructose/sorbose family transporter subunit IID, partial [Escherichia coli]
MGSEISKKDITRLGFRSSLLQASFNYERMQAGGFTWAMLPILKKIYKDDKPGLSAALMNPLMILVKIIKLRWIHILSYDQMVSRKINNQTTRCANSIF